MQAFDYARPTQLAHVLARLQSGDDVKLLAGGQSLLAAMKLGLMQASELIDLQAIPELHGIALQADGQLRIGAMSTHAQLATSAELRGFAPGMASLAGQIADAQIRNRGTIGGSAANFDPAACWPAGLLAMGATLHTDRRSLAADDFFIDLFTTALQPDEVLCTITLPRPQRMAYFKFEQPASRFALVGAAVAQFTSGVRVALTGTTQGAQRLPSFEAALTQNFNAVSLLSLAVPSAIMGSDLHAQADYRAHLAKIAVQRAVTRAINHGLDNNFH